MPNCYNQCNTQCNNPCYNPCNPCESYVVKTIVPANPSPLNSVIYNGNLTTSGFLTVGTDSSTTQNLAATDGTKPGDYWNIVAFDDCGNTYKQDLTQGGGLSVASTDVQDKAGAAGPLYGILTGKITGTVSTRYAKIYLGVKNIRNKKGSNKGQEQATSSDPNAGDTELNVNDKTAVTPVTATVSIVTKDSNRWDASNISYEVDGVESPVNIVKFSDLANLGDTLVNSKKLQDDVSTDYKIGGSSTGDVDNAVLELRLPSCIGSSSILTLKTLANGLSYVNNGTVTATPNTYAIVTLEITISKTSDLSCAISVAVSSEDGEDFAPPS